jgi:muramidase (phage lysozyme)
MHDIHKTLYLMAKRDEDLLNEGLKAKVAAGAILGGVALGMIPPPPQTPPQTQQTQQTPPQTQQTPPQTPVTPPVTPPTTTTCVGPNCTRLLDTISYAEGTDRYPEGGYLTQFSGKQFTNTSAHPDEKIKSKNGIVSSAAGRYQILKKTYTDIGMENMTPAEQDRGALKLIQRRLKLKSPEEVESYLSKNGIDDKALDSLSREWASITDSTGKGRYGQPTKTKEQIRARFAKTATPTETTPTIKKESYKDKIRMYLREEEEKKPTWGPLPGRPLPGMKPFGDIASGNVPRDWSQLRTDSYKYNYGEVFGPTGALSPESATVREKGSASLNPRLTTKSKYGLPIVQSNGHRIGTDGILSVKSHTNIKRKHPKFGQIETHVYDGNTRIATFTSAFNRGAPGMTHTPTNDLFFESDSNSEQSIRRREMDAGSEEFFNRQLNKKTAEYDRDDKIRDVIDDHFNETMGGRKNMTISEFHRTYIEKEFPPPSDGPGDGSSYGELT